MEIYVVRDTVKFWLNEKRPVKEFFYVGDHLFENRIGNDLQIIFTFVRGVGVKAEYKSDQWKWTFICQIIYFIYDLHLVL